jgi:glycosyltransferase involved in cell wall biosynthesis
MRIAQVAPLYESVPPSLYGGTERVVSWLTEELVARGHEVTLFASGDSRTSARLLAPYPRAIRLDPSRPDPAALHAIELGQLVAHARDFDVIHAHVDYLTFPVGRVLATPMVHTLHGRLDLRHIMRVLAEFRDTPLVSISDHQRSPVARLGLRWMATVHHGIPLGGVPFVSAPRDPYLLFIGRISVEKRPDVAIAVAKRLGLPLRIAAKVDPADRAYFEREIQPLLDHPLVEFLGEVGEPDKWSLLGGALCLLFPIEWPEPFGIVTIEAMACGTPVIARPYGSVPEIVVDGRTGFIADDVDEMVAGVKRVDTIDRAACRRHVEDRFSVGAMTDRYEEVYRRLLSGGG